MIPPNDELSVMKAVANGVVTVGMDPYGDDFMLYSEGVFTAPGGTTSMHALNVVGYDETPEGIQYWIVRNSWGEGWGEKGYVRMQRGPAAPQPKGTCVMYGHPAMPRKDPDRPNNEL